MSRRYAIYLRCSTQEQAEKGYNLEAMLEKCQHYIQSQEDATLIKVFSDKGLSGTLEPAKRPGLNQLLQELKNGETQIDVVLIWKLDRLSRSLRDMLNLEYSLRKVNVSIESVTEKIDTGSGAGKLLFQLLSGFAELESTQTAERTRLAMGSKVSQIRLGGKPPFAYKFVGNKLEIDHQHSAIVKELFKRFLKVKNYSKVAEYLNKRGFKTSYNKAFTAKKIQRILINPAYCGCTAWSKRNNKLNRINPREQWIVKDDTHDPIISKGEFQKIQTLIGETKSY